MSIYFWLALIPLVAVSGLLVGFVVQWKRLLVVAVVGVCIPWALIALWVYFSAPTMTVFFAQRHAMAIAGIGYFVFGFREFENGKMRRVAASGLVCNHFFFFSRGRVFYRF